MTSILSSLMSGGWEPDVDAIVDTELEIAEERFESEHPEMFKTFREDQFHDPYITQCMDKYDPTEEEKEFTDIWAALREAECCVEDGGFAHVTDSTGAELPLFAKWEKPVKTPDGNPIEPNKLPF